MNWGKEGGGRGKGKTRTLPAALGDVDRVAGHDGLDREAHVAGLADRRRRRALALLDRARDAAADLQQRDVGRVEVERAAGARQRCVYARAWWGRAGGGRGDSRLARALHVGHLLQAGLEGRGERADEEHREGVEERGELHLGAARVGYWGEGADERGAGGYSKDRRGRQKQQLWSKEEREESDAAGARC